MLLGHLDEDGMKVIEEGCVLGEIVREPGRYLVVRGPSIYSQTA